MTLDLLFLFASASRISNIALAGALDESRPPREWQGFAAASSRIWQQAINHLDRAIDAGEFFRLPEDRDIDQILDTVIADQQAAKKMIFLTTTGEVKCKTK